MAKELVISTNRHETRVAVLEDDQLVEIYFQRSNEYSLAGSIHKGRVTRVLPGMQSAFVDLGLERDTFLYVSDFFEENDDVDRLDDRSSRPERGDRRDRSERQERAEYTPPAVVEAGEPEQETAGEAESEPVASAPATAETGEATALRDAASEAADSRERRGNRRSRRRRGRGRGFPESKYASEVDRTSEPEPIDEAPQAEGASEAADDFLLLPGESLRKYRSSEPREQTPATESEGFKPDVEVLSKDEPEEHPSTNALPDAPAHNAQAQGEERGTYSESEPELAVMAAEEESSVVEEALVAEEAPPELATDVDTAAVGPEAASAGEGTELVAEASEAGGDETESDEPLTLAGMDDEDRDIQEMILGAGAGAQEVEPTEGNAEEVQETAPGAETGPTLASVRDQGGRFMHRMSRRMRRRMRGGMVEGVPSRTETHRPEHRAEHRPEPEIREASASKPTGRVDVRTDKDRTPQASISELLKEGQEILVQIAKEPLGQKGARITSHIALPGRYVVYMPTLDHMGVSRKIASDEERLRLKKILQKHRTGTPGGFIIRTAGEGHTEDEIAADMQFLANLWLDIRQKAEKRKAPALLHHDLDIVQRLLRDQLNEGFKSIWVDNEEMYENVLRFVQRFQPALVSRVKLYTRPAAIFDAFNISNELEKALRPKVWLKSGGYIVINQTEALVAIDINTGKFVGKSNRLEDTIVKTNTEAVKEIVRQIRLRDLGGIIVIDFIDMDERKNRQKVMQALEDALRADRAPYKVLQFNDFGLVAITRKRVKQSLERTLCAPCPSCEGAGYVKSVQTIIGEILTESQKIARAVEGPEVVLRVHPDVAKVLKSTSNRYLEELEDTLKRPVLVIGDAALHHEKFDLA